MTLPVPGFVEASPWPGVYPGDGISGITPDTWIDEFCRLYLDTGRHLQDWEAWRINALANFEAQLESLRDRSTAQRLDASVA